MESKPESEVHPVVVHPVLLSSCQRIHHQDSELVVAASCVAIIMLRHFGWYSSLASGGQDVSKFAPLNPSLILFSSPKQEQFFSVCSQNTNHCNDCSNLTKNIRPQNTDNAPSSGKFGRQGFFHYWELFHYWERSELDT